MTARDAEEPLYDLGYGVQVEWWTMFIGQTDEVSPNAMIVEHHTCKNEDGTPRPGMGSIPIDPRVLPGNPHWQITGGQAGTFEGLTITPSVLCQYCGLHGWIRDGHWTPA